MNNKKGRRILAFISCLLIVAVILTLTLTPVLAKTSGSISLNSWHVKSYVYNKIYAGDWTVSDDHTYVTHNDTSEPTLFYSDFNALNTVIEGTVRQYVYTDDDYFGFAIGYQPGDTKNPNADYLLIDWKRGTQYYNFTQPPSCGPGTTASAGLAVSRVTGIPTYDELWGHTDQNVICSPIGQGVEELDRATNLGNTGWNRHTDYLFRIEYTPTSLRVYVNDVLEIDITGQFNDGKFAFYDFSQSYVKYSNFTVQQADRNTGGGWFQDESSSHMVNFGFTGNGQLQAIDHDSGTIIHGAISDWVYTPSTSTFYYLGICSIKGEGNFDFELWFEDNGEPGVSAGDYVDIQIDSWGSYSGLIQGGNIQDYNK